MTQPLLDLSTNLGHALHTRGWQMALAESCTGGMIAQFVTAIAGSSAWFDRGFVTYSNAAKVEMLEVSEALIAEYGAVSEPVAVAMVNGVLQHSAADICGAITGIAGPSGGTQLKPVGTVCFAWALRGQEGVSDDVAVETCHFNGDRTQVREQAASHLLAGLLQLAMR